MARAPAWAAGLAAKGRVDNHAAGENAKATLREIVVDRLGGPGRCRVLDLFAGSGVMHRLVWHEAADYAGCDERWFRDGRRAFVADNRRLLRCLDLVPFNVFDLDAYGSPWEQATIIAARRRLEAGERIGLTWTDGASMRARLGRIEGAMAALAGMRSDMRGAADQWETLMLRAAHGMAGRMGGRVEDAWTARRRAVWYGAAVLAG